MEPSQDNDSRLKGLEANVQPEKCSEFYRFLDLPIELREQIYELALISKGPIAPQLCDKEPIRFHDQRAVDAEGHNGIHEQLAITRVSRQLREESLPIFYGTNTFMLCPDLCSYLTYLGRIGRLHMIRRVVFVLNSNYKSQAVKSLRYLMQNFQQQDEYEKAAIQANPVLVERVPFGERNVDLTRFVVWDRYSLVNHPQHMAGGMHNMSLFLVIRKLATELPEPLTSHHTHQIVLCVPSASAFGTHAALAHIPTVCDALGIKLQLVEGSKLEELDRTGLVIEWQQRRQAKDFKPPTWNQDVDKLAVRSKRMFPEIANVKVPRRCSYMRRSCDKGEFTWVDIDIWSVDPLLDS